MFQMRTGIYIDKIPHEATIVGACRGLVVRDHINQTVHFAHHTVDEYLVSSKTSSGLHLSESDHVAGEYCVIYRSFADF